MIEMESVHLELLLYIPQTTHQYYCSCFIKTVFIKNVPLGLDILDLYLIPFEFYICNGIKTVNLLHDLFGLGFDLFRFSV